MPIEAAGSDSTPITLFYAYAQADEALRQQLEDHLISLKREELIAPWHSGSISAKNKPRRRSNKAIRTGQGNTSQARPGKPNYKRLTREWLLHANHGNSPCYLCPGVARVAGATPC